MGPLMEIVILVIVIVTHALKVSASVFRVWQNIDCILIIAILALVSTVIHVKFTLKYVTLVKIIMDSIFQVLHMLLALSVVPVTV